MKPQAKYKNDWMDCNVAKRILSLLLIIVDILTLGWGQLAPLKHYFNLCEISKNWNLDEYINHSTDNKSIAKAYSEP